MSKKKGQNAEEFEIEQMNRAELARFERQYRIMEGDREAYSEEMKVLLQKQRKAIFILEKEKNEIVSNLNCILCPGNEYRTEKDALKLKDLLLLRDKTAAEITREKSQIKELDFQIRKLEKESDEIKQKLAEDRPNVEQDQLRCRQQLENRLDVATVKLNRLLADNHGLREEIDHLLKERTSFNQSSQDLKMRLSFGKKVVMDLMEQSTSAYDQREEAQAKLEALKQKAKQDILLHGQEIKELQRKLDHDSKLQQFLGVKGQKRVTSDLEAKELLRRQQQKEALEQRIESYQSLLEKIREISLETEVDRLSAQFVKQEEENFALFNYVNELNNEVESLHEEVEEVRKKMEEQQTLDEAKALEKQAAVDILKEELSARKAKTKMTEESLGEYEEANDALLKGIATVFDLLKHDNNYILQLLGEDVTITSFNVSLFLKVIEKRVCELCTLIEAHDTIPPSKEAAASHSELESDVQN